MLLKITDDDLDDLGTLAEWGAQDAHELSCSEDATEAADGARLLGLALRLLERIDPGSPVLAAAPMPGIAINWDSVFEGDEDATDISAALPNEGSASVEGASS